MSRPYRKTQETPLPDLTPNPAWPQIVTLILILTVNPNSNAQPFPQREDILRVQLQRKHKGTHAAFSSAAPRGQRLPHHPFHYLFRGI